MNYGKALKIARAAAGLQQQELAKKAGLTASYVSLIEMGKRTPSASVLRKLSRALEMPPHLLTLLATEPDDTDLLDQTELKSIGDSLVRLLIKARRHDEPETKKNNKK